MHSEAEAGSRKSKQGCGFTLQSARVRVSLQQGSLEAHGTSCRNGGTSSSASQGS